MEGTEWVVSKFYEEARQICRNTCKKSPQIKTKPSCLKKVKTFTQPSITTKAFRMLEKNEHPDKSQSSSHCANILKPSWCQVPPLLYFPPVSVTLSFMKLSVSI
jgi:hypothetical protein